MQFQSNTLMLEVVVWNIRGKNSTSTLTFKMEKLRWWSSVQSGSGVWWNGDSGKMEIIYCERDSQSALSVRMWIVPSVLLCYPGYTNTECECTAHPMWVASRCLCCLPILILQSFHLSQQLACDAHVERWLNFGIEHIMFLFICLSNLKE